MRHKTKIIAVNLEQSSECQACEKKRRLAGCLEPIQKANEHESIQVGSFHAHRGGTANKNDVPITN